MVYVLYKGDFVVGQLAIDELFNIMSDIVRSDISFVGEVVLYEFAPSATRLSVLLFSVPAKQSFTTVRCERV